MAGAARGYPRLARPQHLLLPWAPDRLLASGGSGGGSDGSGGPGGTPLDISGSVPLLLERVFILLCSQLFGIEVREEVSDVFGGCYAWKLER